MKKTTSTGTKVVIYQAPGGALELRGDSTKETIWATLDQIAFVFGRDKSVISRHFKNIFAEGELERRAVVAKKATTAKDGKTYQVEYYNLDAIISVGYKVNSKTATKFRQWATKTLREHIVRGYTINKKRLAKNYDLFLRAIENVRALLPAGSNVDTVSVLELVRLFAGTWFSLDAYDKEKFPVLGTTKKKVAITAHDLAAGIATLTADLREKNEASELFAVEAGSGSLQGIVGNIMQSFAGNELYPSLQEKAAHLLYFMVKNHPFTDGNKRCGAFAFVWFLQRAGALDTSRLTPEALTALTLFIAESNPKDKEKMVGLVLLLLGNSRGKVIN